MTVCKHADAASIDVANFIVRYRDSHESFQFDGNDNKIEQLQRHTLYSQVWVSTLDIDRMHCVDASALKPNASAPRDPADLYSTRA